jgi:two-component system response regulator FlrC
MRRKKILLVDSDVHEASAVKSKFSRVGHQLCTAGDGPSALDKLAQDQFNLVIAEMNLPQMSGIDLLKKIKEFKACLPVILMSANARVRDAVDAMKSGAHDFLLKPLTVEMINLLTAQPFLKQSSLPSRNGKYEIVTHDTGMLQLLDQAKEIANSRASIFLQGESGTGKELFARYVHNHSDRQDKPFVAINCAALPETLLESELFGHERGAFTGATNRKKGKFELANHGSILLDEISEMDYALQSKLLRVLQEKEIDRVGGTEPIPLDVRIISTTNRDIEEEINAGRFREDLYYRLNVIPFHLPALRKRPKDIPLLADHFIDKYNRIEGKSVKGLTPEAHQSLSQMPWKGNIRELENRIERAVLICKSDLIQEQDINSGGSSRQNQAAPDAFIPTGSLKEMEQRAIVHTLDRTDGNRTHAAEILGISVRTLRNKLNEYREKMEAS